ncbi:MMPL family transporter [Actinophytocola xanthii]|uniref:Transporter n=1 Tax=Actinophytocola xanthii TaxID=1912961 RepID=A0A1Q8CTV0_9PSEU|nr:MMPL family transporter [Actinophytocola xanthii]OLF17773.1 transporter [Actinophytocola xanthii]
MSRTLARIGSFAARHRYSVIVAWLVLAAALVALGRIAGGSFVDDFGVPDSGSQEAGDLTREHFAKAGEVSADVVFHVRSGTVRDAGPAAAIRGMLSELAVQPQVTAVMDPITTGLVSDDGRTALARVLYAGPVQELGAAAVQRLQDAAASPRAAGIEVQFRGQVVDAASPPETGVAEVAGLVAAVLVLLLAFGSLVAAGLPIVTAVAGLGTGSALVLLVGSAVDIPSVAPIVAVMLGLGAGIDYALFLVTGFRQYLLDGLDVPTAAARANATSGMAVLFAGGTVVVAILGLYGAGIPYVGAMGLASALIVAVMVLAALTLLPALLGLVGQRVNALRLPKLGQVRRGGSRQTGSHRWLRWGEHVGRRRWLYAVGGTLLLLVLAAPLLSLRLGMPDDRVQPVSKTQRQAYDLITNGLGPGYNGPLLVAVDLRAADQVVLERIVAAVTADPGLAAVTPPQLGDGGRAGLITLIPDSAPQDPATTALVHRLRNQLLPKALAGSDARAHVGGATAVMIDTADRVATRLPWVIAGVVVASFLLLLAMFRSVLVPLKAALLTLLSVGAAYGVIVAVFQWGWGLSLLGIEEPVPIMSMVPLFLFAVLFGLSMDYEVFLMAKVREDYLATGDAYRSVITGMAATGRVITSAAAIMAVVFLSFVGIANPLVKMIGIGLAVAVVIDATVIRMMLVPALMNLFGKAAWWFPGRGRIRVTGIVESIEAAGSARNSDSPIAETPPGKP